jgi:cell division protein FtsB
MSIWVKRLLYAGVLVGALVYVPVRVYRSDGFVRWRRMQREVSELDRDNGALKTQNQELRREVRRLRDDMDAVGAVARDELGLVGTDEIVIRVPAKGEP